MATRQVTAPHGFYRQNRFSWYGRTCETVFAGAGGSSEDAQLMAIILAIGAAVGWGTADFFGGVSRREASVFVIIAVSELAGVIVLIPIIIARGTPLPDSPSMLLACLAGIAVTVELGLIYAALSRGKAFITAPVGGLGTAAAATFGLLEGEQIGRASCRERV